jgi:PilZ domain
MAFGSDNTIPRKQPRFEVRMPITVSGIDKDGNYFSTSAETVNGSTDGMGLLLDRELYPYTALVILIPRGQCVLQLQTEVRHITPFDSSKKLIGVKFQKAAVV